MSWIRPLRRIGGNAGATARRAWFPLTMVRPPFFFFLLFLFGGVTQRKDLLGKDQYGGIWLEDAIFIDSEISG